MAQKQFKIGLSNTDKQNMAQDVYERLLALTFPEYDTATEYEVGDFVVYNDQLYKCIGATSGAWDSTKWQLATLNDLLTDIENAVAFVNDKANVNGNYPTMTVGFADNLTPYDESAGDDQDEPFILQATGTGNGAQPDFSTGSGALMKEKQGNTVVVNEWLANGDFVSTSNWSAYNAEKTSIAVSNNVLSQTFLDTGSGYNFSIAQTLSKAPKKEHKYLISIEINTPVTGSYGFDFDNTPTGKTFTVSTANTWEKHFIVCDIVTGSSRYFFIEPMAGTTISQGSVIQYRKANLIDLTQWFNGDIPQDLLDNPSNFFRYYQGSLAYNEGALVNANGRYIKCIGMNQWDEEWEIGTISTYSGNNEANNNRIRSKNYIKVLPNATYYCHNGSVATKSDTIALFYDKDKNYLKSYIGIGNFTFTTPSNCGYIRFFTVLNTYNNDISINLYYEDEPRCLTYEPYQVLTNNDTGTETLRSAGSVKDSKAPNGTITRRVGVIDLGSLRWSYISGDNARFVAQVSGIKEVAEGSVVANILCAKYEKDTFSNVFYNSKDKIIGLASNSDSIGIYDTAYNDAATFKTAMSGVYLFYELAEPTTEQGTPYSENLVIDDFGTMDFQGTNGVPQGCLIFYPVDYKAFIDTLYKYTDGTPSNIALKSDVASDKSELQGIDTQLKNALGGTLRQCLCVKESLDFDNTNVLDMGDITWVYDTQGGFFFAYKYYLPSDFKKDTTDGNKILCSKYSSAAKTSGQGANNTIYGYNAYFNQYLFIKESSYTDATAFKNAMKGVLLAYEKASE